MRRFVLFAVAISLLATSTGPSAWAAVPANITRIAIVGPDNPTEIKLDVGGWTSAIGIAMGGAVGGAMASARQKDQMPILEDFKLGDQMHTAIATSLEEIGYTVVPAGDAEPDAVLTLTLADCKYVRRVWGLIGPRITMDAELKDRATGKSLFSRSYKYDMHTLGLTGQLTPEDKYGYKNIEDVRAHPEVVAAGLRAAIPMIAADLATALKKK
jgi:hypothetical protein